MDQELILELSGTRKTVLCGICHRPVTQIGSDEERTVFGCVHCRTQATTDEIRADVARFAGEKARAFQRRSPADPVVPKRGEAPKPARRPGAPQFVVGFGLEGIAQAEGLDFSAAPRRHRISG